MQGQFNALTAQGRTDPNQNTGISIQNCNIMATPDLVSSNGTTSSYLGRPWKKYSRTVYLQSSIDSFIDPAGWIAWSGDFALSTLYYVEYNNTGAGSVTTLQMLPISPSPTLCRGMTGYLPSSLPYCRNSRSSSGLSTWAISFIGLAVLSTI
uniref:Pectinesterase catalytic domain-containing protein n=1 Tax=Nelumbo nucifera TaxID=4432 RepID=A0A822YCJ1_NELNU|nr:TPA_asm: hypothetical protein HUJ06_030173 [Nelumbo nucifera]